MAAYSRVTALSREGATEFGRSAARAGTRRPAIAAVCAGSTSGRSGRTASAVRSRSAASTNGSAVSPSWQRAASTTAARGASVTSVPGPHIVVQPGRLGQRPDGQIPVQHADQRPVLPHGGRTLAGPAVQPDDRLMGGFVQGIELQPALGVAGRALQIALVDARRHQPLQAPRERLPQPFAHRRLPLLEVRAAAQDEAGQEVVPVEPDRPLKGLGVRPRDQRLELGCSRPVTASRASRAMAFLVSKVTGVPSRTTTGGPSRARPSSVISHLPGSPTLGLTVTYLRKKTCRRT